MAQAEGETEAGEPFQDPDYLAHYKWLLVPMSGLLITSRENGVERLVKGTPSFIPTCPFREKHKIPGASVQHTASSKRQHQAQPSLDDGGAHRQRVPGADPQKLLGKGPCRGQLTVKPRGS